MAQWKGESAVVASRQSFQIEFDPAYLAEMREQYDDVEEAVREAIPWIITRVLIAPDDRQLRSALGEFDHCESVLRAFVGCEVLGQASSRPDVRRWLCEYAASLKLGEGARYQLAGAYSRLGVESRRSGRLVEAVSFARQGLDVVADLPPRAVTANLYYNLGIALERKREFVAAIEAFEDSAEIDELIGRHGEASLTRQRVNMLQGAVSK